VDGIWKISSQRRKRRNLIMWYRFTKTFQGGQKSYIEWVPDEDIKTEEEKEKTLESFRQNIGHYTFGGHCYGWNVKSEECVPTIEELSELIKDKKLEVEIIKKNLILEESELDFYNKELERIKNIL
jgi:hypothetical protein